MLLQMLSHAVWEIYNSTVMKILDVNAGPRWSKFPAPLTHVDRESGSC